MDLSLIRKALGANLIEDLGIESLPEEEKLDLLNALTELVGMRLTVRIQEKLPKNERRALDAVMGGNAPLPFFAFLSSRKIEFEEMLLEEIAKLRDELASRTGSIS